MVVTHKMIVDALNIPLFRATIYSENWFGKENTTMEAVLGKVVKNPKVELKSSNLKDQTRIMYNMCVHALVPRLEAERVKPIDLILVYHRFKRYVIKLPQIIFNYIIYGTQSLRPTSSLRYGNF